ncbi:MAG: YicC family protein [Pseudoflavonifractor sp.]|nr:YicC family protein [Pseudoflavonifractor sp.]
MTGFGKATTELAGLKITVEVKSLNSKQMDISTRVPQIYREKELEVRNVITQLLERGKADVTVYREVTGADDSTRLNIAALAGYKRQIDMAAAELGIPAPADWFSILMRFPDAIHSDSVPELEDAEGEALITTAREAASRLMAHRRAEGLRLEEFFTTRVNRIACLLDEIEPFETERVDRIRGRITEGLAKISIAEYDRGRLEQEMIFYIEKLDVNEEKQRLAQHLRYFIETMGGNPGQGKKLGFIAQEMGREINTLGSKSNHAEMQRIVVKMKDELEQIKEQVLNVM